VLYNITTGRRPSPFIWFRTAKTGTRTVLKVLRDEGVDFDIEQGFNEPAPRSAYADHFSFTFVRNPYDRLISGWTDKVLNAAPGGGLKAEKFPELLIRIPPRSTSTSVRSRFWSQPSWISLAGPRRSRAISGLCCRASACRRIGTFPGRTQAGRRRCRCGM
jgi:hypothetical protein